MFEEIDIHDDTSEEFVLIADATTEVIFSTNSRSVVSEVLRVVIAAGGSVTIWQKID